ncbi:hypothetical protein BV25DRAFT_1901849 [Artomyces pyxidatus]|uniref:Uncharacterized protein n=1 Tax=Artomyces pyxidatus TaxID=48021 RepID=A0ACB8SR37_9AGAM|nr:hypothetical protein BV25DRAFT_1901849 [Artomyces pyxidatus]
MAQALFDDHPLQAYLKQSGDGIEPMPGAIDDSTIDDDVSLEEDAWTDQYAWQWLPLPLAHLLELTRAALSSTHPSEQEFTERFKYDVISSSLLSSSISAPQSARRRSFPLPGDAGDHPEPDPGTHVNKTDNPTALSPHQQETLPALSPILFALTLVSLFSGYVLLSVFFGTTLYYFHSHGTDAGRTTDTTIPTLNALHELIEAGNLWESAVSEAITTLEHEEANIYPSTSPVSPPSGLRVALHTSLHTTQSQADNVRHLLAALTSPASLAQLSEMYAPPSPIKPFFALGTADQPRPHTLAASTARQRTRSAPSQADKRMTWNGSNPVSYSDLASAGSPSKQILKKREKRRSDLSALMSRPPSFSAPTTPNVHTPLAGVKEESDYVGEAGHEDDSDGEAPLIPDDERSLFGTAALDLQRQRRSSGMDVFRAAPGSSPPPSYTKTLQSSSRFRHTHGHSSTASSLSLGSPLSSYSSSRFTAMQTHRHPLSLSALHHAVQGAVAAKRYAASHLLALRFTEADTEDWGDDNEAYWEDVRAVMALLTSTLADNAARLVEALDQTEHERLRDQNPTPVQMPPSPKSHSSSPPRLPPLGADDAIHMRKYAHMRTVSQIASFAPVPSHLARFAAHVDAMSTALNEAREHLEACVTSLRSGDEVSQLEHGAEPPALQAYERLRKELGLALRECERGRERLLDIVAPRPHAPEDDDEDDVPALGPDADSDDSDKLAPVSPDAHSPALVLVTGTALPDVRDGEQLPPPGIEQVFEAEPDAVPCARERAKLPREERIRLAKLRRESGGIGLGLTVEDGVGGVERWGPGGDVVQELKDVIWQVGERRRRRAEEGRVVPDSEDAAGEVFAAPRGSGEEWPAVEADAS